MRVSLCVDELGGMMFNRRRVSRDREVIADVCRDAENGKLYSSEYSAPLFEDAQIQPTVSSDFLDIAKKDDLCFVESEALAPYLSKITVLTVYKWNRRYPSDVKLDIAPERSGFKLLSVSEFAGYSHEKITKEVYVK